MIILLPACHWVSIRIDDGQEHMRFCLPFSALKAALTLSGEGDLSIEDLGGIDAEIDLPTLAAALKENVDAIKIEIE